MATIDLKKEKTRFDIRLSKEQKMLFEKAALLGDYRSLTEFVIRAVQEKAKKIISEKEKVIASQRDSEIFFNAVVNSSKANNNLVKAANEYKDLLSE